MSTGSGPLYSSITKNWFQSQLLRWRERGPPSSDSMTHFVRCRILSTTMPLTPVSRWRAGRRVYSSELGTRLWALITPSTSSFVRVLLFLRFTASSRLRLANGDLAAMSSMKPKWFGFLEVLGRGFELSFTLWCGISKSFKFFKKRSTGCKCGKIRCRSIDAMCKSRSSFKRPALATETCLSKKRNSRKKGAAMAEMNRSLCFKEMADQVQGLMGVHPDWLKCLPPPWSRSSSRLLSAHWLMLIRPLRQNREKEFLTEQATSW